MILESHVSFEEVVCVFEEGLELDLVLFDEGGFVDGLGL